MTNDAAEHSDASASALAFVVAIPARYAASRLPGKPLRLLGGEPLVLHVVRRALAAGAREVIVATDDDRVAQAVQGQGAYVCMTRVEHASGTDRLAECAEQLGWADETIVVNLQGDEPFAPAEGIRAVALALAGQPPSGQVENGARPHAEMATLAAPIHDTQTLFDPNTVKLVRDADGMALYFSRAPMPWARDRFAQDRLTLPPVAVDEPGWLRHIGIYAYRAGFLRRFAALPSGWLERTESLEQLRALEAGHRIAVALTPAPFPPGIDTLEDLRRAQLWLAEQDAGRP